MAADDFDDPFAPASSLPDELDALVKEAYFEFDDEFSRTNIKLDVEHDNSDFGDGHEGTVSFSIGGGWDIEQKGGVVTAEDGNVKKKFHPNTGYYRFFSTALALEGAEDVLRGEGRGNPKIASMWNGLGFHFERQLHNFGGEIGERPVLVPTQFLGEGSNFASLKGNASQAAGPKPASVTPIKKAAGTTSPAAPAAGPGPAKKAAAPVKKAPPATQAAAPATPATTPGPAVDELPENANANEPSGANAFDSSHSLWQPLYDLAMECDTPEQFAERAYAEIDGVVGDDLVEQGVMDIGEGSVWQTAVNDYQAANG